MEQAAAHNSLRVNISYRQILGIALPISLAMLVPQLNYITNNIFLGQLSEQSLAAAAITGVYYLIFAAIGFGLNNGLQALISRRAGESRPEEIGKLFIHGVGISMSIAVIGILVTYTISPWVLQFSIHDEQLLKQSVSFLKIRIWGLPFLYVYQMRNALLVGTNQSKYLIAGTLAEAISNIFFDYSLIFGHFGFPKLGFDGAAIASIISEFLGMAVVFAVIHYKGIGKRFSLFSSFKYDASIANSILAQSSPLIFQNAISIISWEFFYILIEHHGERDLSISNAMRNIFGLFGMFSWALAATCSSMVSNIIGQGLQHRVIELILKIVKISTGIALVICLLLNLFPFVFLSVYGQSTEWINHAIPVLRIVSSALVLMSFSTVCVNAVTGTGNTKISFLIEFITISMYCFYVWLVLEKLHLSVAMGWTSEWLYWGSMFTMSFIYLRSGRWKG
ncbi:MAG TPA: MATE family efflux transporter, partial [Chitinophagaceae bacterium]|nr:MATE family efflux transporter [Chitinophagaceae bacterium]